MNGLKPARADLRSRERLSVTLVGPEYPINVGYTARLIKNFGIPKLYLIEPRFDRRVASVYAAHGADVIESAQTIDFDELRRRHNLLVATTAVTATKRANVVRLSLSPEEVVDYASSSRSTSLVFGRDTTGLTNDEIARCDVVTTVTTGTRYRTLNVSHSVAVLLYLFSKPYARKERVPNLHLRDAFASYAYELAIASGLQEHRAERLFKLAKRISLRSNVDDKELSLLLTLLRKATVAVSAKRQD
jgi:TrmH family RNA methyltransferase